MKKRTQLVISRPDCIGQLKHIKLNIHETRRKKTLNSDQS